MRWVLRPLRAAPPPRYPSCPGWTVADLLRHVGSVHYRASLIIGERRTGPPHASETAAPPGDPYAWYEHGRTSLLSVLAAADPSTAYWTFRGTKPLQWWLRRLAHETGVHRVDAEQARGSVGPIDPWFAADGIDEHLETYLPVVARRQRLPGTARVNLGATDVDATWTVTVAADEVTVVRRAEAADAMARAHAVDLYLWWWRRASADTVEVQGDAAAVDRLRAAAQV